MPNKTPKIPIIKLTDDQKKRLDSAGPDIEEAERAIEVLDRLGVDPSDLKDKLTWAKTTRETLLKEFS